MYKLVLDENFNHLKDFLLGIKQNFNTSTNSLHKARNEIKILNENGVDLVVKSFKVPNLFNKILYRFFKKTKAQKSYEHSLRVGSFTPHAVGYIEFYENGWLENSYFVSKKFEYDFTIREVLLDKNFMARDVILTEFVKFTYNLHENQILHLDYSPGNILIKQNEQNFEFKIVDINRMKFQPICLKNRMKNFRMLWASDDDIKFIATTYAKLANADEFRCVDMALKFSRRLKARKNFKKRLREQYVAD